MICDGDIGAYTFCLCIGVQDKANIKCAQKENVMIYSNNNNNILMLLP